MKPGYRGENDYLERKLHFEVDFYGTHAVWGIASDWPRLVLTHNLRWQRPLCRFIRSWRGALHAGGPAHWPEAIGQGK